jgi:HAD superfamily hydrolase (TIGR01549 family)
MFNYILFDFDNTIYDYDYSHTKALDHMLHTLEKDFHIKDSKNIFKDEKKKFKYVCYNNASTHNKFIQIKKLFEVLNLPLDKIDYYYDIYQTIFNDSLLLYPNIIDFLNFCKNNNIKMFIVTNNLCQIQIQKMKKLNILSYFTKIYTSEEYGIEKPDSKLFSYIINDIGCSNNEIVNIGDNFINDINSVTSMDIYSFWFSKKKFHCNQTYLEFDNYDHLLHFFKRYYEYSNEFIKLSNTLGERFDLVQAGGGNTSFKLSDFMFIKSSGSLLSDIDINKNYVGVNYKNITKNITKKLITITEKNKKRREYTCNYIINKSIFFLKKYKPSIETSLHSITKKFTVHIHPIQFNMISSHIDCNNIIESLFNKDEYCILEYCTPGIDTTLALLSIYNNQQIIFLKNHGIVVTSNTVDELQKTLQYCLDTLETYVQYDFSKYKFVNTISDTMADIFNTKYISYLSEDSCIHTIVNQYTNNLFSICTPDTLIYCGMDIIKINKKDTIVLSIHKYKQEYNDSPKIFLIKYNEEYMTYITSTSINKCRQIESVFKSHLMCNNKQNKSLDKNEIKYLNNWEAEKYRKCI